MTTVFNQSIWGDEGFSAILSMKSLPEIIKIIATDTLVNVSSIDTGIGNQSYYLNQSYISLAEDNYTIYGIFLRMFEIGLLLLAAFVTLALFKLYGNKDREERGF